MSENSKIEWCHHTFNGWIGCTKVSPGCLNCYAERDNARRKWNKLGWGKGVPRHRTKTWGDPVRWNKQASKEGRAIHYATHATYMPEIRPRVFCSSLSDWLDDEVPIEWLADLLELIRTTPNLDWLLLSKRPGKWRPRLERVMEETCWNLELVDWVYQWLGQVSTRALLPVAPVPPANVWIGTTVEDQQRADERIAQLLSIPAKVRFLSCEPLLGPVNLGFSCSFASNAYRSYSLRDLDWVICGGESGPGARPMQAAWARSLRDQCQAVDVPFLFKQWGEWLPQCQYPDIIADIDPDNWCHAASRDGGPTRHIGKKNAGRLLDGKEWNGYPQ